MVTIDVPDNYGLVVLACAVVPTFTNIALGGPVMKARQDLDVPYPNLYATPGFHKHADEFNRIQRGHQSMFETITHFTAMSLLGGLKHPLIAAASGICYSVGNYCFLKGYADVKLDVKDARYKKGGLLKWVGYFGALGSCISIAGTLQQWW